MKSIITAAFIIIVLAACHSGKTAVTDNAISITQTNMNDTAPLTKTDTIPLIVQFYSIGEGINGNSIGLLDAFVAEQEKKSGKSITSINVPWGREGEFDKCFRLANLSETQRKTFISELKKVYDEKSLVHISENVPCRNIRQ